jgi:pilus assembly protein CpaE
MVTMQGADTVGVNLLSVVLIGPDERRREQVIGTLTGSLCGPARQLPFYPDQEQISQLIEKNEDVLLVDLDSNLEAALEVVEDLCARSQATVMVYSASSDPQLMVRCMQAGVREFLTLPVNQNALAEAMVRASVRRSSVRGTQRTDGRLFVFWGAKGGSGVTTVATNFAVSLARESNLKVLLIDLDLPLGDAALHLGLTPQYSTADALRNTGRLDGNFLSRLVMKHSSGVSVLAAPDRFVPLEHSAEAVNKLVQAAREEFDLVVVDSGSHFELTETSLFAADAACYMVLPVGVPELRNANRMITEFFAKSPAKLEIILNRYSPSSAGVDEERITKALTRTVSWRIPEDLVAVRKTQSTATPLVMSDSGISKVIRQMTLKACGLAVQPEKKKGLLGLF